MLVYGPCSACTESSAGVGWGGLLWSLLYPSHTLGVQKISMRNEKLKNWSQTSIFEVVVVVVGVVVDGADQKASGPVSDRTSSGPNWSRRNLVHGRSQPDPSQNRRPRPIQNGARRSAPIRYIKKLVPKLEGEAYDDTGPVLCVSGPSCLNPFF